MRQVKEKNMNIAHKKVNYMNLLLSFLGGFELVCELLSSSRLETLALVSKFIRRSSSLLSGISFLALQLQLDNMGEF